jgi:hypothetical protein
MNMTQKPSDARLKDQAAKVTPRAYAALSEMAAKYGIEKKTILEMALQRALAEVRRAGIAWIYGEDGQTRKPAA